MGVIGRTDPRERMIVRILVAIEFLPVAIRVSRERIYRLFDGLGLKKAKRQHLRGGNARAHQPAAFDEITSIKVLIHIIRGSVYASYLPLFAHYGLGSAHPTPQTQSAPVCQWPVARRLCRAISTPARTPHSNDCPARSRDLSRFVQRPIGR